MKHKLKHYDESMSDTIISRNIPQSLEYYLTLPTFLNLSTYTGDSCLLPPKKNATIEYNATDYYEDSL